MTSYGPIFDLDGYRDYSGNFVAVLRSLHARKILPRKSRKVRVFISFVFGTEMHPQRGEREKTYTFGYLCRTYEKEYGKDFTLEASEEKAARHLASLQKQGEKTYAWNIYAQYLHFDMLRRQEQTVRTLPIEKQEAARKENEKQNGSQMIRIG